jgi:hypothetical protein
MSLRVQARSIAVCTRANPQETERKNGGISPGLHESVPLLSWHHGEVAGDGSREQFMDRSIIQFAELQRLCAPNGRPPRPCTVRKWADRQGIAYLADGRGGIWTTLDALNRALGVTALGSANEDPTRVEDLA